MQVLAGLRPTTTPAPAAAVLLPNPLAQQPSSYTNCVLYVLVFVVLLQTLAQEGIKGIYKGVSAPLATVALFNAVLFASRGQMEVLLKHADGETPAPQTADAFHKPMCTLHSPACSSGRGADANGSAKCCVCVPHPLPQLPRA